MNRTVAIFVFAHALFATVLAAQGPDAMAAIIDGTPILESELKVAGQTNKLERQIYDLKLKALQNLIGQRLAAKAAAAKNLTVDAFLQQEVDSKISDPAAEEVEAFYLGQKDRINQPLEAVRAQAAQALKALRIREARQVYMEGLRQRAQVTINLQAPKLRVDVGNAPRRGPATAPVTIVEFSDFQCPYCRRVEATLTELLSRYAGQISIAHKDMPLDQIHPEARSAAEAARCAQEQDRFWQYRDALFTLPGLNSSGFEQAAQSLQLDLPKFQTCLNSHKYRAQVQADADEAQGLGVTSTPTFFINGAVLEGAQPTAAFSRLIEAELEARKAAVR